MSITNRGLLVLLLTIGCAGNALADGEGTPHRRGGEGIDRGERVIRTPDTTEVPADLHPRRRRDIQITIDPHARRRGVEDVTRSPRPGGIPER